MALDVALGDLDFWLDDPLPAVRRLRQRDPVHWSGEFWALLAHRDIADALRKPGLFSSAQGVHRRSNNPKGEMMKAFLGGTILMSDPPDHTVLRRMVSRGFTVRAVAGLEPRLRELASEVLDRVELGQALDFVHDIAEHVPATIVCELMGVPREDHRQLARWMDGASGYDLTAAPIGEPTPKLVFGYLQEFVAERRRDPRDDLITKIAAPDETGRTLDDTEVLKFCFLLLMAGTETTRASLSRGIEALARWPAEHQRLRDDHGLLPTAVEEILRYSSITPVTARTVTADVEVGDATLREGEQALLFLLSANYDESVFGDDAADFRVDRAENPHLSFGFGAHVCIGAPLARLEIRVFLEELMARFSCWEVGQPETFRNFEQFRSYRRLPIVFSA